jgi:hypothetical protein
MTTPPGSNEPPRGGTPLDDAMAGRDAGDEPLVGGDADADAGTDLDGNDPTTEAEEDPRFA